MNDIQSHLFTAELPDVDLVIRTGGDMRLSNFLLWQSAYATIRIVENYWPAIDQNDIESAIKHYSEVMYRAMGRTRTGNKTST